MLVFVELRNLQQLAEERAIVLERARVQSAAEVQEQIARRCVCVCVRPWLPGWVALGLCCVCVFVFVVCLGFALQGAFAFVCVPWVSLLCQGCLGLSWVS